MSQETNPSNPREPKEDGNVRKFLGVGFEMALIIGLFVYAGIKIDAYYGKEPSLITALLSVLGVFIALYNLYRRI